MLSVEKPTELKERLFTEAGSEREKLPDASVEVPEFPPLTETPDSGVPWESVTLPLTVLLPWANEAMVNIAKLATRNRNFLM